MQLLERIENQIAATGLPLVGITVAAVPCPDTPVILTLHWHGFVKEKAPDGERPEHLSYSPVPSSALQLNDRWGDLLAVDRAALDAAWELGAWDVARAERKGCLRPGAPSSSRCPGKSTSRVASPRASRDRNSPSQARPD